MSACAKVTKKHWRSFLPKKIDYYLSLISPWTFMGHKRIGDLAQNYDAEIIVHPVDFSKIFPATGGLPLAKRSPQRQAYRMMELKRWRDKLGIPLTLNPKYFPAPDTQAALIALAAKNQGHDIFDFCGNVLKAVWMEEKDITDEAVLTEVANQSGFDGAALVHASKDPAVEAAYAADSEAAIERGAFGAPTYIIDDEVFWGQDRLEFVEAKLKQ
jgi:2-hydroxychromene-2-carboxylate isomerase